MRIFISALIVIVAEVSATQYQFDEGVGVVFKYLIEDTKGNEAFQITRRCSIEHQEYIHTVELVFDKLKVDVVNTNAGSDDYDNCEGAEIESIALTKEKALCYNKVEPSVQNVGFIAFMNKSCQNDMLRYFKRYMGEPTKRIPFDMKIISDRCANMDVKMKSESKLYYNAAIICSDRVGVLFINKERVKDFENARRLIEEKVEAIENAPRPKDDF